MKWLVILSTPRHYWTIEIIRKRIFFAIIGQLDVRHDILHGLFREETRRAIESVSLNVRDKNLHSCSFKLEHLEIRLRIEDFFNE